MTVAKCMLVQHKCAAKPLEECKLLLLSFNIYFDIITAKNGKLFLTGKINGNSKTTTAKAP